MGLTPAPDALETSKRADALHSLDGARGPALGTGGALLAAQGGALGALRLGPALLVHRIRAGLRPPRPGRDVHVAGPRGHAGRRGQAVDLRILAGQHDPLRRGGGRALGGPSVAAARLAEAELGGRGDALLASPATTMLGYHVGLLDVFVLGAALAAAVCFLSGFQAATIGLSLLGPFVHEGFFFVWIPLLLSLWRSNRRLAVGSGLGRLRASS